MAKIRLLNSGWYVSQEAYREYYLETPIYAYDSSKNEWSLVGTGELVKVSALPETPENMWPLRLASR